MGTKEKISEQQLSETDLMHENEIILYNDDVNTFDHVIDCLVAICDHTPIQAEQCALLTHINGKCDIVRGEIPELKAFQEDLELYGLNVQIL